MTKTQAIKEILYHTRAIMEVVREYGHHDMFSVAIDPNDDYINFNNGIFGGKYKLEYTEFAHKPSYRM